MKVLLGRTFDWRFDDLFQVFVVFFTLIITTPHKGAPGGPDGRLQRAESGRLEEIGVFRLSLPCPALKLEEKRKPWKEFRAKP